MTDERLAPDGRPMVQPLDRAGWRAWLAANHATSTGVWLAYFRKGRGPRIDYAEGVEEALCFGWIDSVAGKLDADRTLQWYSPRRPGSGWARPNKERVARVIAEGLMEPAGQAAIDEAKRRGTWALLDDVEDLIVPDDLAAALEASAPARTNWEGFSRSVRKGILTWIVQAKRPETRARRIAETARLAAFNEKANQPARKD